LPTLLALPNHVCETATMPLNMRYHDRSNERNENWRHIISTARSTAICNFLVCSAVEELLLTYILTDKHCTLSSASSSQAALQRASVRRCWQRHPTIVVSPACCRAADYRHPTLRAHHSDTV